MNVYTTNLVFNYDEIQLNSQFNQQNKENPQFREKVFWYKRESV